MAFDIEGARLEGYSDSDIARHLSGTSNFDYEGAVGEGYTDEDILGHLTAEPAVSVAAPVVEPIATPSITPVRGVEDRTVLGTAKDIGISALKGAIALPQAAVGLLDIPTGGHAGKLFEKAGFRPEVAQRILSTFLSPAQQAASKEVAEAEGFLPTVEAAIKNPSVIAQAVIESAPSMLGGAGIARGIIKVAPKLGALVAAAIGEGAVSAGSAAEELRSKAETGLITPEESLKSLASGVGTGLFGLLGGRIAQKAGIADVDTLLAGGIRKQTEKGVVRRIVEGGISEGLLEELPQSAQETMWMNSAEGRPLMEGVGSQSAMGMLAGVAMGAGFNVIGSGAEGEPAPPNAVKSVVDELVAEGLDSAVGEQMIADFEEMSSPDLTPEENISILSSLMEEAGVGIEDEIAAPEEIAPEVAVAPEEVIPEEIIPETTETKVAVARENIKTKALETLDTIEPETDLGQQVKGMLQDELAKTDIVEPVIEAELPEAEILEEIPALEEALPAAEIIEEAPVAEEVLPEIEVLPEEVAPEIIPEAEIVAEEALPEIAEVEAPVIEPEVAVEVPVAEDVAVVKGAKAIQKSKTIAEEDKPALTQNEWLRIQEPEFRDGQEFVSERTLNRKELSDIKVLSSMRDDIQSDLADEKADPALTDDSIQQMEDAVGFLEKQIESLKPKEIAAEKAQVKIEEAVKEPTPEFSDFKTGRVRIGKSPQGWKVLSEVTTKEEEAAGERYFEIENEKTGEKQIVTFEEMKPIKAKKTVDIPFKRREEIEVGKIFRTPERKVELSKAEVESLVATITTKWKNAPKVIAVDGIADLPAHLQDAVVLAKGQEHVEGIFDPETQNVYLVAGNIDSTDRVLDVLFHESLGHFGIRELLGKDITPVLNQVYAKHREEAQKIAKQYGFDTSKPEGRRQAAEEVLANIAQTNSDPGIIKKAIAAIRKWLRKMGFNIKLSDNDIQSMMEDAAQFVKAENKSLSLSGPAVFSKKTADPTVKLETLRKAFENTAKRKPPAEETDEDARKIDAPASKARKGVQRWAKRFFTKEGLLNKIAFEKRIEMDSAKNVGEQDIAAMVTDFNKAVSKAYGVKKYQDVPAEDLAKINGFMAGKDVTLPAGLKEEIQPLRDMLDMLSDGMMQAIRDMEAIQRQKLSPSDKKALQRVLNKEEGAVLPKSLQKYWSLYETINKNKGQYLTRSYQAFEDPDWKEKTLRKKGLMNRAKAFIRDQNPSLSEGEVLGEVSAILQSAKESGDFLTLISQGEKLGSKDTSIITRRKDIPPVILELLGEYRDPKINFVRSASKMQYYIANHNFLMDLRRSGLNTFLFEKATVNKGGSYDAQVATKDSDAMNPLNGLYTTADFKQGLKDASDKFQGTELMRNIIRVNSMIKYGKTILSPTTQARNFMSAAMFSVMNGHFDWTHMGKAFKAARSDLFTQDKEWRAYLDKLIGMGVVHDNPFAGELRDAIKDFTDYDTYSTGPNQNFRKILDFFQRSYQVGDDFWKIIGYENEVALQKKVGLSQQEAEKKAAFRIRNGYPTYSMVPKGIKAIRRWPLLGTFVSFPYEIMRTTRNQLDFIKEDMAKPETRSMGARRALGFAMASAAAYSASITSMAAMGMDSDDDEAVRAQLPEWSRNSQLLYTGYDEDGLPTYLDLSYLDPYTYVKKPLTAILSGNNVGIDDKIVDAMREFLDPFIGADIAAGAIGEIIYNQKEAGGQVYNPEAQGHEKANDILQHLRKAAQPGVLSNMERTIKAIEGDVSRSGKKFSVKDEGLAWLGLRFGTLNLRQSMIYKGYGFSDKKSQASRILNRAVGSAGTVSEKEIKNAVSSMMLARKRAYGEMSKLVEGAMKLGVKKSEIRQSLRAAKISNKDISSLLRGRVPRWSMSSTFIKSARDRAVAAATTPERKRELRIEMGARKRIVREAARGEREKN
jgi:hypothetical protein